MDLIQDIINRAKANPQHIVFPEGTEERTLKAADRLLAEGVVRLTLIGDPSAIRSHAQELGLRNIDKANLLDPKNHEKKQAYIDLLLDLRRKKGLTEEQAAVLVEDPLYLGCLMVNSQVLLMLLATCFVQLCRSSRRLQASAASAVSS